MKKYIYFSIKLYRNALWWKLYLVTFKMLYCFTNFSHWKVKQPKTTQIFFKQSKGGEKGMPLPRSGTLYQADKKKIDIFFQQYPIYNSSSSYRLIFKYIRPIKFYYPLGLSFNPQFLPEPNIIRVIRQRQDIRLYFRSQSFLLFY